MLGSVFSPTIAFTGYALAFGIASLGCLLALGRARTIDDPETRRGLVGLFVGSGGWALLLFGFLLARPGPTAELFYLASLVVGLTTVGAWLYFCSAYTGRSFHRNRTYRQIAVAVYLGIVAVKVTNPLHELYYTTEFVTTPFAHLTIEHGLFHWVVTGFSYALAAVGFFMLYEMFLEADYDTRPLAALVGVTALPVVLDIAGFSVPQLIDINYEPLGVVVFAIGVLYVFNDRFLAVQLTEDVEEAVVYLDRDDRIREFNGRAREVFPELADGHGQPIAEVLPAAAARLGDEQDTEETGNRNGGEKRDPKVSSVLERRVDGDRRYLLVSDTSFTLGQADVGRLVMFTDVTESEYHRRELRRHNEQLEWFAAGIRHELLNSLQIVDGWVNAAGDALDGGNVRQARDALQTAGNQTDRMTRLVDDFAEIARYGRTPDEREPVDVAAVVTAAYEAVDPDDLELAIDASGSIEANAPRLQDLFEYAFEFAEYNAASSVTVAVTDDGVTITGDGDPLVGDDPEAYFDHGSAVPSAEAGMLLPNVRMLARAMGFDATIDPAYEDGIRIELVGAVVPSDGDVGSVK